jgi:O-antigen/teichoic acid export membrane protein
MPVAALAPFALAMGLVGHFERLFGPITIVFYPAITHLDARRDTRTLRAVYLVGSRLLSLTAFMAAIIGFIWAADFFRLWVGSEYTQDTVFGSPAVLFDILIVGAVVTTSQRIGYQTFLGLMKLRAVGFLLAGEAIVSIVLTLSLIQRLGLIGVALGSTAPALAFQMVLHPLLVCRFLGIPGRTYLRKVSFRLSIFACVLLVVLGLFWWAAPPALGWGQLLLYGCVAAAVGVVLAGFIGLQKDEREYVVSGLLRRAARLLHPRQSARDLSEKEMVARTDTTR